MSKHLFSRSHHGRAPIFYLELIYLFGAYKHKENTVQATSPHPYSLFQQKHKKIRPFSNSSTIFHFSERLMFKLVTVYITIVRNAETMLCVVRNRLVNRLGYAMYRGN